MARFNDLPRNARIYLNFLQRFLNVNVSMISVGVDRTNVIMKGTGNRRSS